MSEQPPDDPVRGIIDQVDAALADLNITDDATRDAVAEGLKEAMRSLESMGFSLNSSQSSPSGPGRAKVEVVEGGRAADEPPSERRPPRLRVAAPPPEEEDTPDSSLQTRVRVLRASRSKANRQSKLQDRTITRIPPGHITVDDGARQTIHRAARAHPYRLHCDEGAMRVMVDGQPLDTIQAGQSIDIEGAMIQVRGEKRAVGRFERLSL